MDFGLGLYPTSWRREKLFKAATDVVGKSTSIQSNKY